MIGIPQNKQEAKICQNEENTTPLSFNMNSDHVISYSLNNGLKLFYILPQLHGDDRWLQAMIRIPSNTNSL